jgi:hypothetical protein
LQAKIRHLQHESFTYQIRVDNSTGVEQEIVFRIFMAPLKDETGRSFSLREQQLLMIELDKFVKTGENLLLRIFAFIHIQMIQFRVVRASSNVIHPKVPSPFRSSRRSANWSVRNRLLPGPEVRTNECLSELHLYKTLLTELPVTQPMDDRRNFCGCGWPHYFLIPRGRPDPGMPFVLFVMASSWKDDQVIVGTSFN